MKDWRFMLLLLIAGLVFIVASLFGETTNAPYTFDTLRWTNNPNERLFEFKNAGHTLLGVRNTGTPTPVWLDGTNELASAVLATNVTTEWITVEDRRPQAEEWTLEKLQNPVTMRLAVMRYDDVKQVGFVVTNRVLHVVHDGTTNDFQLKTLYRDEWPSQKRTLSIPR